MSQSRIRRLYESRLKTWADSRQINVAWQNSTKTPPAELFLSSHLIPSQVDSDDLKGDHRSYTGTYQVNVHGVKNEGPGATEAIAELLQALFPNNLRLSIDSFVVQIVSPASLGPPIEEPDRYTIAVYFSYRGDTI